MRPLGFLLFCSLALGVQAATYTVTTTADSGAGSLRQGITDANSGACADPCAIAFGISTPVPGSGYFTIRPLTQLPGVTASHVVIDGTTQTTATGNTNPSGPEVEINGSLCATSNCIGILLTTDQTAASNRVVRGLAVTGFSGSGISDFGNGLAPGPAPATNDLIAGNYIGIDPTGFSARPNHIGMGTGRAQLTVGLVIGGTTAADRNVISGNTTNGILTNGPVTIIGNFIGTDRNGTSPVGNHDGIEVAGSVNDPIAIGGTAAGAGNTISGNTSAGIVFFFNSSAITTIRGNRIGSAGAPNKIGIQVFGGRAVIGDGTAAGGNDIAFNTDEGILEKDDADQADLNGNSIHDNAGPGIVLAQSFGPTLTKDDNGITSAEYDPGTGKTTIQYTVGYQPGPGVTYRTNFYSNTTPDPSTYGEGETFLARVTTVSGSNGLSTGTLIVNADLRGKWMSTSTNARPFTKDVQGTTTANPTLNSDLAITKSGPATALAGSNVTYTIHVTNNGPSDASDVVVSDPAPGGLVFVSNQNDCTTAFPCALGTIPNGATRTIQSTFAVDSSVRAPAHVTNTATVSATNPDPSASNNSASTDAVAVGCPDRVSSLEPSGGAVAPTEGALTWGAVPGATSYTVYLGLEDAGCSTQVGNSPTNAFPYSGLTAGVTYVWRVVVHRPGCGDATSTCGSFRTPPPPGHRRRPAPHP